MSRSSKSKVKSNYVSVARDFSPHPGPRLERQGEHSGEAFRKVLVQMLREHDRIKVNLDGTSGYGSSFLDEAFGGLVSKDGFSAADVLRRVELQSEEDRTYIDEVHEAIELAEPRKVYA